MKTKLAELVDFFRTGIWVCDAQGRPCLRLLRLLMATVLGFRRDKCVLHASALTYYTMIALVPVLAMSLALAKVFGADTLARAEVEKEVTAWVASMEQKTGASGAVANAFSTQMQDVVKKGFDQINSIDFGQLGFIGAAGLLLGAIGLLGKIEASFNAIWNVRIGRTPFRTFADYFIVLVVLAFILSAASSLPLVDMVVKYTAMVNGRAADSVRSIAGTVWMRKLIVFAFSSAGFAFLLGYMPNAKVKFGAALTAGLITAFLFAVWLKVCMAFQVGIARNSMLYGSFAALPILLFWVYTSWQIVLLGAELAFTFQAGEFWGLDLNADAASPAAKSVLALLLCRAAADKAMGDAPGPLSIRTFAAERKVSFRLAQHVAMRLAEKGILAATDSGGYLLVRAPTKLSGAEVLRAMLNDGTQLDRLVLRGTSGAEFDSRLKELDAAVSDSFKRTLLD